MSSWNRLITVLSLLQYASAQSITLSSTAGGFTLPESPDPYEFCVNLDVSPSGSDLTVMVTAQEIGSATSPEDYQFSGAVLTFMDGTTELQQCFSITLVLESDNRLESREFFRLTAAPSSGSSVSQFIFIENQDSIQIGLAESSYTVGEADGTLSVCVVFVGDSGIDGSSSVGIMVTTTAGTATVGSDYDQPIPTSVMLNMNTGAAGECSIINIINSDSIEATETFTVSITSSSALAVVADGRGTAEVSITEDDEFATVSFVEAMFSVAEGSTTVDNTQLVCLEVMLPASSVLERDVVVQVTPSDGTATSGVDYTAESDATVTFSPSDTNAQCIRVTVIGDFDREDDETVTFSLSVNSPDQTGAVNSATLTITNDDADCGQPPSTNGGTSVLSEPTTSTGTGGLGATAEYSCDGGYQLADATEPTTLTCLADDTWSPTNPPSCSIISEFCSTLSNPQDGTVSLDSSRTVNTVATYSCDDGLVLNGDTERTCQADGTWSGTEPTCTEAPLVPTTAPLIVSDNRNRNIGIGVGVGVGGFLLILVAVIIIVVIVLAIKKKRSSEKYVLNYSTVYGGSGSGSGSGSGTRSGNDYSMTPSSPPQDGGESGSNGVNEKPVDVGEDETTAITFKEE